MYARQSQATMAASTAEEAPLSQRLGYRFWLKWRRYAQGVPHSLGPGSLDDIGVEDAPQKANLPPGLQH